MRINKFIAQATGLSRRAADAAIEAGKVSVNGQVATLGQAIAEADTVTLDGRRLDAPQSAALILLNKPVGYVVSRDGQGSKTIYDLLPPEYHHLKPIGRLDKDSSGLLLLTNDGQLAQELTHPIRQKIKVYEIVIDKPLTAQDKQKIEQGIPLDDGPSKLQLARLQSTDDKHWQVTMHEGRNRQIRRTFAALSYTVTHLHRSQIGEYSLRGLSIGASEIVSDSPSANESPSKPRNS
jgi:23S rRNA pseudouridine2605 synthase